MGNNCTPTTIDEQSVGANENTIVNNNSHHQIDRLIDTLTQELQSLNLEQKQRVSEITDRTVDIEKPLLSLQIDVDNNHTNTDDDESNKVFPISTNMSVLMFTCNHVEARNNEKLLLISDDLCLYFFICNKNTQTHKNHKNWC